MFLFVVGLVKQDASSQTVQADEFEINISTDTRIYGCGPKCVKVVSR